MLLSVDTLLSIDTSLPVWTLPIRVYTHRKYSHMLASMDGTYPAAILCVSLMLGTFLHLATQRRLKENTKLKRPGPCVP